MSKLTERLVTDLLIHTIRGVGFAGTQYSRAERFLSELALHTLDPDELERLTCAIYDAKGTYREDPGLMPWEEAWFARDLPPAPARVLVGGAGSGREVRALHAQGYEVIAFEPAPAFVRRALALDANAQRAFLLGSYSDLVDSSRPRHADLNAELARFAPYDAALVGWGSFSHIPGPETRFGLLARLRELCPRGPLLASFFMQFETLPPEGGRMERWGRQLAATLRQRMGQPPRVLSQGESLLLDAGYAHQYTAQEIDELATRLGARLAPADGWPYPHEYPHCAFLPTEKSRPRRGKSTAP